MRQDYYAQYHQAELTHWWFRGRRHILGSLLRQFLPAAPHRLIADIGCGTGASLDFFAAFGKVVGAELSTTAVDFARHHSHHPLLQAQLPELPFPSEHFDLVSALDLLEHIPDDQAAATELWRICKPGGFLLVTVPAYQWLWSEHDDINQHQRRYTRAQLQRCLHRTNAQPLKLSYMNSFLAPPAMAYRVLRNCAGRRPPAAARADIQSSPVWLNAVLEGLFKAETCWLRHGNFPFGISLVYLGRKHDC